MRKTLGAALAIAVVVSLAAAPARARELPATTLSYRIAVDLDPDTRAVRGTAELRWRNVWAHPITAAPLHLYMNAFAHERTTWMSGVPADRLDMGALLEVWDDPWGWIEPTAIRQVTPGEPPPPDAPPGAGPAPPRRTDAPWRPLSPDDGNPLDRTLISVTLPRPVLPREDLVLEVQWQGRMPIPIARTGCIGGYCLAAQWFPKIAVLEHWKDPTGAKGGAGRPPWALRQFHGLTEFYADFADYDVTITVPAGFLVGATGRLAEGPAPAAGEPGRVSVRHAQRAVHDFAFVVGRDLSEETVVHTPPVRGAVPVTIRYVVRRGMEHQIARLRGAVEAALDLMSRRVGPYPYDVLTVVAPPWFGRRTGGMEYPTLITGVASDERWDRWPWADVLLPEVVAAHEFVHQYFYGLFASDERREAFLDEGFTSFWEGEILAEAYGGGGGRFLGMEIDAVGFRALQMADVADRIDQPMAAAPSFLFEPETAGAQFYPRPATTLATAQAYRSPIVTDQVFRSYYRRWAFGHPSFEDFLAVAASAGGTDLEDFLREAFSAPRVPNFRVATAEARAWAAPRGRIDENAGVTVVTEESRDAAHKEAGLDPAAREAAGTVLVEVTDPGWYRGPERREDGRVERRYADLVVEDADPDWAPDPDAGWQESLVTVQGPAWDHLPVDVVLRFADGAVVRDAWPARGPWRRYRFVRRAPLLTARIDPQGRAVVDVRPADDALSVRPDARTQADLGLWIAALGQWLGAGLSLWL